MLSEGAPPRACVQADEEVEWVLDRADVQGDRALDREELRTAVTLWRATLTSVLCCPLHARLLLSLAGWVLAIRPPLLRQGIRARVLSAACGVSCPPAGTGELPTRKKRRNRAAVSPSAAARATTKLRSSRATGPSSLSSPQSRASVCTVRTLKC